MGFFTTANGIFRQKNRRFVRFLSPEKILIILKKYMKKWFNRNKKKKPVSARSGSHTNRSGSFPKQAEKSRPKIPLTELPSDSFFPSRTFACSTILLPSVLFLPFSSLDPNGRSSAVTFQAKKQIRQTLRICLIDNRSYCVQITRVCCP